MKIPSLPKKQIKAEDFESFCTHKLGLVPARVESDLKQWLFEDAGSGDASLFSIAKAPTEADIFIIAKEDFILCGLEFMAAIFRLSCGSQVSLYSDFKDGQSINSGQVILAGKGNAAGFLLGERVALNLGARLSGIATKTFKTLKTLQGLAKGKEFPALLETRKTTPGHRLYEKYATRVGGARNHRHGTDSGLMLKENHLRLLGGIQAALFEAKKRAPILLQWEVEVTNLSELAQACEGGAHVVMLDNFSNADTGKAVLFRNKNYPQVKLEISGNLDRKDPSFLVKSGVDYMSQGALIHQAQWVDMSLQLFPHSKTRKPL